jgi:hypothetical protein
MSEEKESKKKKAEFDEDVSEMADIYDQLARLLVDSAIKPTPDGVEAMAVSLVIGRNENKRRDDVKKDAKKREETVKPETPTNTSAAPSVASSDTERICPTCGTVLIKKYGKNGRGYFSCGTCKQFVNDDGKLVPWKNK